MRLKLPRSLHYPITVTELLKQPNDHVDRLTPLFRYTYESKVEETDRFGVKSFPKRAFSSQFESNVEGTLKSWMLSKGVIVSQAG